MDKKRLLFGLLFLIVCLVLGYFLYRTFFQSTEILPPTSQTPTSTANQFPSAGAQNGQFQGNTGNTEQLPTSQGELPTTVSNLGTQTPPPKNAISQVVSASVTGMSSDNSRATPRFYNEQDGKFYRIGADGNPVALSDQVFYNVQDATWSPTQNQAIIQYPDNSKILYDFSTKKQVTLPSHWENFSFNATGDKIAAKSLGLSEDSRWLVSADPQGTNVSFIEPLGNNADKVTVDWSPNKQVVALATTGEDLGIDRQEVLFVGQNHENNKSTVVEGRGLTTQWSPNGANLLYSVYSARSDFKPELWIVNSEGDGIGNNRKLLQVNTWADKCTFADTRYVYCGVPQKLDRGTGFAPSLADSTPDDIYRIDTQTGIKSQLPSSETHTINSVYVGNNGKTLYFTDKNQPGLFKMPL